MGGTRAPTPGKTRRGGKAWVLDATVEPARHFLPVIIKHLLRTAALISRHQGGKGNESAAISFQRCGICGADGGILETEDSQLGDPAEHVLHLVLVPLHVETSYHRLFPEVTILKVAFRALQNTAISYPS